MVFSSGKFNHRSFACSANMLEYEDGKAKLRKWEDEGVKLLSLLCLRNFALFL